MAKSTNINPIQSFVKLSPEDLKDGILVVRVGSDDRPASKTDIQAIADSFGSVIKPGGVTVIAMPHDVDFIKLPGVASVIVA